MALLALVQVNQYQNVFIDLRPLRYFCKLLWIQESAKYYVNVNVYRETRANNHQKKVTMFTSTTHSALFLNLASNFTLKTNSWSLMDLTLSGTVYMLLRDLKKICLIQSLL